MKNVSNMISEGIVLDIEKRKGVWGAPIYRPKWWPFGLPFQSPSHTIGKFRRCKGI